MPVKIDKPSDLNQNLEVRRKTMFAVVLTPPNAGLDADSLRLSVVSFGVPKIAIERLDLPIQNTVIHLAGIHKGFDPVDMICRDLIGKDIFKSLLEWFKLVYNPETGVVGSLITNKYKGTGQLMVAGPDGADERIMDLEGVFPEELTPGDTMKVGENAEVQITCKLSIDNVIVK